MVNKVPDAGCGYGALLMEIDKCYSGSKLYGVDQINARTREVSKICL
ncbi:MAG: class I SAM-dependent methyltransferase [Candidatus Scalindua rubra]|uniref:Uncharacterized protein n=1 Tax=Candidatus Scalindua brodae TaxID=237368 RepID=A0A0B0EPB4_9BACT|nr:MAG: hypothetical protein SCABRO_01347 [Candidatus Scalindua brodae]MBZ0110427.1 class I SAM-dependent methyltransferase [Candidatus Scalindua rubra]